MELMHLASAVLVAAFIGWNMLDIILSLCGKGGLRTAERIALSYCIGIASITLEMFLFYLLRVKFDPVMLMAPWAAIVIANGALKTRIRKHKRVPAAEKLHSPGTGPLQYFLIPAIGFEVIYTFFRALIKPLESYDAVAIYAIKAKIFYLAKAIPADFFRNTALLFPHPDYPLNIPLAETFIYLFLGTINDQLAKIIFPLYYLGVLVIMYCAIRRFAGRNYALLCTFILASVPQFSAYATNGYLDLVLSCYVFAGVVFLMLWFKDNMALQYFIISALMMAFAGWTKNEGAMYCIINVFVLGWFLAFGSSMTIRKKIEHLFLYIGIIMIISLPWFITKQANCLASSDVTGVTINPVIVLKNWQRIGPILYEFQKELLGPKKWNIVWILVVFAAVFRYKKAFSESARYLTLFLAFTVAGYTLVYMTSHLDVRFFVSKTWSRFLLHFLPVTVYWLAIIMKEDVDI